MALFYFRVPPFPGWDGDYKDGEGNVVHILVWALARFGLPFDLWLKGSEFKGLPKPCVLKRSCFPLGPKVSGPQSTEVRTRGGILGLVPWQAALVLGSLSHLRSSPSNRHFPAERSHPCCAM